MNAVMRPITWASASGADHPRAPTPVARGAVAGLVLVIVVAVVALPAYSATRPIRFNRLSLEQGLSQGTVLCIHQDSSGFMWFGTEDGLNLYDGFTFTHFRRDVTDPGSLDNDFVWGLGEDSQGRLWVGTDGGGLSRWDRRSGRFTTYRHDPENPSSLASDRIRALLVDSRDRVWLGTFGSGLSVLDPETGEFFNHRHDPAETTSIADDHVFAIIEGPSGEIWVATDGGVDRLDPGARAFVHLDDEISGSAVLSDRRVRALHQDIDGAIWIGTYGGGLGRYEPEARSLRVFRHDPQDPASLSHDRVRTIVEDHRSRLWIGTINGLDLFERQSGSFAHYRNDPANVSSLSGDDVISLYQDRGGVLWIGTQAHGVSCWDPSTWTFGLMTQDPSDPQTLSHDNITSFTEDMAGRLWIGTFGGGINVLDRSTGEITHHRKNAATSGALGDDRVMALLRDSRGRIWAGTLSGGLNRYDPASGSYTVYRSDPDDPRSLAAPGVMSLFEDSRGTIWVGTFGGGVNRYDHFTGGFQRFLPDPSQPGSVSASRITCFDELPDGRLWVGTDGGGVNLFDPRSRRFRHFRHDPDNPASLSSDTIFAVHVDGSGRLWAGTRGCGLDLLETIPEPGEPAVFRSISQRDGLANNVVYGIQEDGDGSLWVSTNLGLSRLDASTWEIRNFTRSHGLQGNEFNFGAHFRTSWGELVFGGPFGFNAFRPDRLELHSSPPPVAVTAILKLNEPLTEPGMAAAVESIELDHSDAMVTFEFAAMDFAAPMENNFACLLEGFDEDWVNLGTVRRVTYTNLDAGRYTFRVRAANCDGVWNEAGTSLAVIIKPAPWETWWAYSIYGLLVVGAAGSFIGVQRNKLRREEAYSHRLEEDVEARTAELAQRNTELEETNQKLAEASLTDALTGLANRRFLFEYVDKEIALVRRRYMEIEKGTLREDAFDVVFMMVDIDHFKVVNDTFGHVAGDLVLTQFRDILKASSRGSDILIRWGGDEFLVVGRDSSPHNLEVLAERIRSRVDETVFNIGDGRSVRATCSIGFACYPFTRPEIDTLSWEQVVSVADRALYAAKRSGRNAWIGLHGTDGTPDSWLYAQIQENTAELVEQGKLGITSSLSAETSIGW